MTPVTIPQHTTNEWILAFFGLCLCGVGLVFVVKFIYASLPLPKRLAPQGQQKMERIETFPLIAMLIAGVLGLFGLDLAAQISGAPYIAMAGLDVGMVLGFVSLTRLMRLAEWIEFDDVPVLPMLSNASFGVVGAGIAVMAVLN